MKLVTLLSDFGARDPYVGTMKGVLLSQSRQLSLVDLSHDIPRHDVGTASFWISRVGRYFPPKTVHLCVIDPGVGTSRRALALLCNDQFFVGPDNGIFSDLLYSAEQSSQNVRAVTLTGSRTINAPTGIGATFHGRDVFAPAAALLALGQDLSALGEPIDTANLRHLQVAPRAEIARVRVVDHFGNLITDAPSRLLEEWDVVVNGRVLSQVQTYGEGAKGELVALAGSWETIEVAVPEASAAKRLDATVGMELALRRKLKRKQ